MDGDDFFIGGVLGFIWHFSGGCSILSVTISEVGGGKLKSAVVGAFSGMYCRPNIFIEKIV